MIIDLITISYNTTNNDLLCTIDEREIKLKDILLKNHLIDDEEKLNIIISSISKRIDDLIYLIKPTNNIKIEKKR